MAGCRIGVVCTTESEARCLRAARDPALEIRVSGGDPLVAQAAAEALVHEGAAALLSFGAALGLAPILRPGDLVLADSIVIQKRGTVRTEPLWRELVQRRLQPGPAPTVARLAGADVLPVTPFEKHKAFQATCAAAVDTDSHAVALVAHTHDLPILALRVVAEPADAPQPPLTRIPLHGAATVVALLALRPWQIPAGWRHVQNCRLALSTLKRVAGAVLAPPPTEVAA